MPPHADLWHAFVDRTTYPGKAEVLTEQLGTKTIYHPHVGPLVLHHLQSAPTSHPDLRLIQFAPADEATRHALVRLVAEPRGD